MVDVHIISANTSSNQTNNNNNNNTDTSLTICNEHGDNDVYITFLTEHGNLPLLKLHSTDPAFSNQQPASYVNIYQHVKGTKEDVECGAMGVCDQSRGICECVQGYLSSNGTVGFPGSR